MTYTAWIEKWISSNRAYGKCAEAVAEMIEVFPELESVKGHAHTSWGKRAHWWCTTEDGAIIDPTASQFGWVSEYEPWVPGDEVRAGKCMECGDDIWVAVYSLDYPPSLRSVCGSVCRKALEASFNV